MAEYVTLDEIKAHASVAGDVSDALLTIYSLSAHAEVANFLNRTLEDLLTAEDPETFPVPVKHAILILCANAVLQRETIIVGTISSELPTVQRLLQPYRVNMGV